MNLAVHDFGLLAAMRLRNQTTCWERRGIVPWTPPGFVRARKGCADLVQAGCLRQYEIGPRDAGFFDIFRQRLRGLAHREETLLFLAAHSASVVLAGEPVVVEQARALGLRVWAGEATQLDELFPLPAEQAAPPPPLSVPDIDRLRVLLSDQFPSARRVPECEEPAHARARHTRPGRAGSLRPRTRTHRNREMEDQRHG
jgi:hypothetical protein